MTKYFIGASAALLFYMSFPVFAAGLSPVALYGFDEGQGAIVIDQSQFGDPVNLTIQDTNAVSWVDGGLKVDSPTIIQSAVSAAKITNAIKASNQVSIEAWVKAANDTQTGPARIVSLSTNSGYRNVTLGQMVTKFNVRLRTDSSLVNNNGIPATVSNDVVAPLQMQHVVYTRDTNGQAYIYVNGIIRAAELIPGTTSNWDSSYPLLIANELVDSRPWLGTLYNVAIFDQVLTQETILERFSHGSEVSPVVSDAPTSYKVTAIDRVHGSYNFFPEAINNDGVVVGMAWYCCGGGPSKAFSWTAPGGRVVDTAYHSEYRGINNKGDIAGTIGGSNRWFWPTVKTASGTIHQYYYYPNVGRAVSINDVGYGAGNSGETYGLWDYVGGTWTPITFPPKSINNKNQIVGRSITTPHSAMLYDPNGGELNIGTLGKSSVAYDINDAGVVVGWGTSSTGICTTGCGFVYDAIYGMRALPKLSSAYAMAASVNVSGDAVGNSIDSSGFSRAVLWNNGDVIDLNSRISEHSGWVLTEATAINDNGQIVGIGTLNGISTMYVLTPQYNVCP